MAAADVHGVGRRALRRTERRQLERGDDRGSIPLGDRDCIPQVIAVAVREQHRVDLREAVDRDVGRGIACEERVDDHTPAVGFEREAGVAVKRDRHHPALLSDFLLVRVATQERVELGGALHPQLDHPARPVGVTVD